MSTVEPIRSVNKINKIKKYLKEISFRNYLIFVFGINTGLRISDILNLNICDVKNKTYVEIKEQKTKKIKTFPLNIQLREIISDYLKTINGSQKPLFVGKMGYRLHRSSVYRFLNKACKNCGIDSNVGTHTMRKTFGYHHYKKYKNIAILQKILNHSPPYITLNYIGISQDEIDFTYKNFVL